MYEIFRVNGANSQLWIRAELDIKKTDINSFFLSDMVTIVPALTTYLMVSVRPGESESVPKSGGGRGGAVLVGRGHRLQTLVEKREIFCQRRQFKPILQE